MYLNIKLASCYLIGNFVFKGREMLFECLFFDCEKKKERERENCFVVKRFLHSTKSLHLLKGKTHTAHLQKCNAQRQHNFVMAKPSSK